jgi:hypothetical protein
MLQTTGSAVTVAFYASAVAIPALISVYLSREARGIDFFGSERNETPDISINMDPTAESGAELRRQLLVARARTHRARTVWPTRETS